MKDQLQNTVNFIKQQAELDRVFSKLFDNAKSMKDVEIGFSYLTGDLNLAQDLMSEMLPREFSDKSNSDETADPLLKITKDNLFMYYNDFYNKKFEEQVSCLLYTSRRG